MRNLDFIAIGDIVIDAFIRLQDAEVIKGSEGKPDMLAMRFGDKIPYESVEVCNAVGNAPNAATSAARLGLASGILTYIGGDQNGRDCMAELQRNTVHTDFVHTENDKKTNYHYVLWYGVDRTILIKHEKFDYSMRDVPTGDMAPKWIYLSSLGEHSQHMYGEITEYLKNNPEVQLAFQPGVFDIKLGAETLHDIYAHASAICCNVEEAQTILHESSRDLKILLQKMASLGPKKVFITDSINGAYTHDSSEPEKFWFMPIYPHTPYERTGAGDAFFSTVVSMLCTGRTLTDALRYGPINSMSVVQQVGAQKGLLSLEKIEEFLANAPTTYTAEEI